MEKLRIGISNSFLWIKQFQKDNSIKSIFWAEILLLIIALFFFIYQPASLSVPSVTGIQAVERKIEKREIITTLPSELFFSEKTETVKTTKPVLSIQLHLTGIGLVKGIYKASLEDKDGNYYYVREGEKIKGLTVNRITQTEVLLKSASGETVKLQLEQ